MIHDPLYRHPAMRILEQAITWELRLQVFMALALAASGCILCYVFFQESVLLTILGLVAATIGTRQFFKTNQELRLSDHPILHTLKEEPHRIVWVYAIVTQRSPFGFAFMRQGTMFFKLSDGDALSVLMPSGKLKLVSRFLNRLLPHAAFGYSTDREQLFEVNPEQLRRRVNE
ncbi:MAG: hypothetical protein HRU40_05950 [Saprospiraceae bacterium]|nr:hypothetical protein [Saprospiraceae bacterium]